jgi:hypothetical protein
MKSKKLRAYLALEKRVGKICKTSPKKAEDLRCKMDRLWFAMSKTDH